jgi:hypothetical protein
MNNIDLNIGNYTINELYNLFKIDQTCSEEKVKSIITKIINSAKQSENSLNYIFFLKKAEEKMIQSLDGQIIDDTNNPNKPTNYRILEMPSIVQGGEHNITKNKIIPVQNTYDYKYPTGVLNPVEKKVVTKILCLDTLLRQHYYNTISSNFTWTLPFVLQNVISMKIVSLQIGNNWHTFSTKRRSNQFTISLFNMVGHDDCEHTITIPDGNYMSDTFITAINNYFNNIGGGLQFLYLDINTISSHTILRARVSEDSDDCDEEPDNTNCPYDTTSPNYSPEFYFVVDFRIESDNRPLYKNAGWMMGFKHTVYTVTPNNMYIDNTSCSAPIIYYGYLESESSFGSSIWRYFFVDIDDFNRNFVTDSIISPIGDSNYLGKNIMARIVIPVSQYSTINDNGSDFVFKTREYFGPVNIEKLHMRILNKFGDVMDMLENDFSLALEFSILYS